MRNRDQIRTNEPRKRFVIRILRKRTRDASGKRLLDEEGQQIDPQWEVVDGLDQVRCSRRTTNGDYAQTGPGQVMPHETQVFCCRINPSISVGHYVDYNGQIMAISRIVPVTNPIEGRLEEMEIYCMGTPR